MIIAKILRIFACIFLITLNSCGVFFPNTMSVTIKNNYESSSLKYVYDVKVNYSKNEIRLNYGEQEEYVVNWWRVEDKELTFETKLYSIGSSTQNTSYVRHKVAGIKNFQKVTITLKEDGDRDNLFDVSIE